MTFDARFSNFGLVEKLARAAGLHETDGPPPLPRVVVAGATAECCAGAAKEEDRR